MFPVYVMIGGRSSRFGKDKATHPVDGEPWALHVGRRLGDGNPILVGGEPPTSELVACEWTPDVESTSDAKPSTGPLAGVLAALAHRRTRFGQGRLVLASCDLVRPEAAWLSPLVAAHDENPDLVVAAYHAADRWQPYPSVLHTRWLEPLERLVGRGERSLQAAFGDAAATPLPWPGDGTGPPQANTPEDLRQLLSSGM